jgi:hypothetical protein
MGWPKLMEIGGGSSPVIIADDTDRHRGKGNPPQRGYRDKVERICVQIELANRLAGAAETGRAEM